MNNIKDFFLSKDNINIIYNVILNKINKSNNFKNINDSNIKNRLNEIQLTIMNLVYDSKDYYLELENETLSNEEIIKFLNRKSIDRCQTEFKNIIEKYLKTNNININNAFEDLIKSRENIELTINKPKKEEINFYNMEEKLKSSFNNSKEKFNKTINNSTNHNSSNINSTNHNSTNVNLVKDNKKTNINTLLTNNDEKKVIVKKLNTLKDIKSKITILKNNNKLKTNNNLVAPNVKTNHIRINNKNIIFYSLQRNWSGMWENKTENKIIIARNLMKSPHNSNKYNYTIKNTKKIKQLKFNKLILPVNRLNPNNIDLMVSVLFKNLNLKFNLTFDKKVNNYLYYTGNNKYKINEKIVVNNLLINIVDYNQNVIRQNPLDVFTIKKINILKDKDNYTLSLTIKEDINNNLFLNNDSIIIKNVNLNFFVKHNQNITKENIKKLNNWINKEHNILLKDKQEILIYIDNLSELNFLKNQHAFEAINQIKKENLGMVLNKTTQHILDFDLVI